MNRNLICKNDIVDAVKDYSPNQVKLFYGMLYRYKEGVLFKQVCESEEVEIDLFEIKELLGNNTLSQDRIYDLIMGMPNEIRAINKDGLIRMPVFKYIKYSFDDKCLSFKVNEMFSDIFLEILNEYTIIHLQEITKLNSKYSQRLYELARRYVNQGNYTMKIEDFKEYFQVPKSYKMGNIDQNILNPASKELQDKTNINCSVTKRKRGRDVTHIHFNFSYKKAIGEKEE